LPVIANTVLRPKFDTPGLTLIHTNDKTNFIPKHCVDCCDTVLLHFSTKVVVLHNR